MRVIPETVSTPLNGPPIVYAAECTLETGTTLDCTTLADWTSSFPEVAAFGWDGEIIKKEIGETDIFAIVNGVTASPIHLAITDLDCSGNLYFADDSLTYWIRHAIGKPEGDIHIDDVRDLTQLGTEGESGYSGYGIQDLAGIECLTHLESLDIDNTTYPFMSPIALQDLSPLSALTSLEHLSLVAACIWDPSPLEEARGQSKTINTLEGYRTGLDLFCFPVTRGAAPG